MSEHEKFFKIVERLDEIYKPLENNVKLQVLILFIFMSFLVGEKIDTISLPVVGVKISISLILIIFPIILLYLLVKMTMLSLSFIGFSELFYDYIYNAEIDKTEESYLRAFFPNSIFAGIIVDKYTLNKDWRIKFFQKTLSTLFAAIPGFNFGICMYAILNFHSGLVGFFWYSISILIFVTLSYEFYNGTFGKKYRTLFFAFVLWILFCLLCLFLFI